MGLRDELREGTSGQHQALDQRFAGLNFERVADYVLFLQGQSAALIPLEDALERLGVESLLDDWRARSRRAALLADLTSLRARAPQPVPEPNFSTRAHVLGAVYVLEGSRLGAKLLLQDALRRGPPPVRDATHFLSHGAGARLWRSFLTRLETFALTPAERGDLIVGANQAFAMFIEGADVVLTEIQGENR